MQPQYQQPPYQAQMQDQQFMPPPQPVKPYDQQQMYPMNYQPQNQYPQSYQPNYYQAAPALLLYPVQQIQQPQSEVNFKVEVKSQVTPSTVIPTTATIIYERKTWTHSHYPTIVYCTQCQQNVNTIVIYTLGAGSWLMVLLLFLFFCPIMCLPLSDLNVRCCSLLSQLRACLWKKNIFTLKKKIIINLDFNQQDSFQQKQNFLFQKYFFDINNKFY